MADQFSYLSAPIRLRCISRVVLYPSTRPIDAGGAVEHKISVSGAVLSMFVARSPGCAGREPVVYDLEFSGNGSRAELFTRRAARRWGEHPVDINIPI